MKKLLTATILAAGVGIACAAPAFATEGDYLYDLHQAGYTGDDGTMLGLGYGVCDNIEQPQDVLVEAMFQSTGDSIDHAEARYVVEAAELYLC